MHSRFLWVRKKFSRQIQQLFKHQFSAQLINNSSYTPTSLRIIPFYLYTQNYSQLAHEIPGKSETDSQDFPRDAISNVVVDEDAVKIQNLLKRMVDRPVEEIERSLDACGLCLSEDLVLNVLKRHRSDWKPAYAFFNWVLRRKNSNNGYFPGTGVHNQMLDILGRMHRFDKVSQVLDEMSKRENSINERTYGIVVNRYAAAHKIDEAIDFYYKRKYLGLELDLIAFQTLLLSLCRHKHVEAAEFLFNNKKNEFKDDIKTRNIILNGWCVLGNLREAKRFWNDIVTSECRPDKFTYGIFINSLTKAGKISTAVKLFQAMWEKGCKPDLAICNCVIYGLCFKKRISEALQIFQEMNERDCLPDVITYNSLIKHLCKIQRMDKVYELLDEMEMKGESCSKPNARTYGYLLNSSKKPEEAYDILERMKRNGCKLDSDSYNLVLRLFMNWGKQDEAKSTWDEMEKCGLGPDQRSYTIMIHGFFEKEMIEEALHYFHEMTSKGMVLEPRTKMLVDAMNIKLNKGSSSKISNKSRSRKSQ